jgi:hypothetical protein
MTEIAATSEVSSPARRADFKRLMLFFALGLRRGGHRTSDGLISQPLNYYLKQVYQWTPVQITAFLTVLNLPWFLKPVYGSCRISCRCLARGAKLSAAGRMALPRRPISRWQGQPPPNTCCLLLLLAGLRHGRCEHHRGASWSENGQRFHASSTFVNQQWLWFEIAAIGVSFLGGALVQYCRP